MSSKESVGVTYVIDASVTAEYLLLTPLGQQAAPLLESAVLLAPELLSAEVLNVLRRALLQGVPCEKRTTQATVKTSQAGL